MLGLRHWLGLSVPRLLIETTELPMADVAFMAGFSSVRAFNGTVRAVFGLSPTGLRRRGRPTDMNGAISLRSPFRVPLCPDDLFGHLVAVSVPGVEEWRSGVYRRTLRLPHGHGVVGLRPTGDSYVQYAPALSDLRDLTAAISRCRRLLDLDADPVAIDELLGRDPTLGPLVRHAAEWRPWRGYAAQHLWTHRAMTMSRAVPPPSAMTADGEMRSTTRPPTRAPREIVAWTEEVNSTEAASRESGAALANQVWEATGTAP